MQGMLGIVAIFLSALLLALTTVLRQRRRLAAKASAGSPPPVAADPNCWVLLLLGLASLEAVACTFRVVSNYQPQFSYNDNLLYPLQVSGSSRVVSAGLSTWVAAGLR